MRSKSGGYLVLSLALSIFLVLSQSHKAEGYYYDITNDTNISTQELDALYPIARYAGMGYNILRGNPEGDFNQGGRDPGIRKTRWIFNLTYTSDKKGRYGAKTVAVPDQVEFHPTQSCASRSRTKAYSGQSSYQHELQRNIGGGLSGGFSKLVELGFSLSGGMKQVEKKTKDSREVIVQETKICNLGSVRYKDELVFDGTDEYVLSAGFKNDVKKLPSTIGNAYSKFNAYYKFIERWGTHVILSAEVGTRFIERQSATYSEVYSYLSKQKNFGTSIKLGGGAKGFGASGNFNIDLSSLNDNVNGKTKIGHSKTTLTIGSKESPAPIKVELMPLTEALTELMWGPGWKDDGIAEKQKNLATALLRYPSITGAHVYKDPNITVIPKLTWLSGGFAMPEPASGCPEGFKRGCLRQDTYNMFTYNSWSSGINSRLTCDVNDNYIVTCFCVKNEHPSFEETAWPLGSYCIAKKDMICPKGFDEGFIKWDDKDLLNKNGRMGQLPDGKYDRNTKIEFCCRNDASSRKAMLMPTLDPFILYRYSGHCQKIQGMTVQEDYIEWINEGARNKDEVSGAYPDDYPSKKKRHRLFYCHYSAEN